MLYWIRLSDKTKNEQSSIFKCVEHEVGQGDEQIAKKPAFMRK